MVTARKRKDGEPVSECRAFISGFESDVEPANLIQVINYADVNLRGLNAQKKYSCPKMISEVIDVLRDNTVRRFSHVLVAEDPEFAALDYIKHSYEIEMDSETMSCELIVDGDCVPLLEDEDLLPPEASERKPAAPAPNNATMWGSRDVKAEDSSRVAWRTEKEDASTGTVPGFE